MKKARGKKSVQIPGLPNKGGAMFNRNLLVVWIGIVCLSGMFLMGQESWNQSPLCSYDTLDTKGDGVYTSPDGKGELTVDGNMRILKLKGTDYEMGYNQGYLLAEEIMNFIHLYVFEVMGDAATYLAAYGAQSLYDWGYAQDELDGMLAGIRSALTAAECEVCPPDSYLEIPINRTILQIYHTSIEWMACSSFSIWGDGRSDGSTLHARNLDFSSGPNEVLKEYHAIISRNPVSGNQWVSIGLVGTMGTTSCINEHGQVGTANMSNCYLPSASMGYVPAVVGMGRVAETATADVRPAELETILEGMKVIKGGNIHVCRPSYGRDDDEISAVLEYDGNAGHVDGRCTQRKPSDNSTLPVLTKNGETYDQTLPYEYGLIATNHYLERKKVAGSDSSMDRYVTLKDSLDAAKADGHVDLSEARDILEDVGQRGTTVQSMIFEPHTLMLHVYLSNVGDGGAFNSERHDFHFSDLILD